MAARRMADALTISVSPEPGYVVVSVAGGIDMATAAQFRDQLASVISGGARRVVVDLAWVTFMASAGVGVLMGAHRVLAAQGGSLVVASPSPAAGRVLSVVGLDQVVPVTGRVAEAAARWASEGVELPETAQFKRTRPAAARGVAPKGPEPIWVCMWPMERLDSRSVGSRGRRDVFLPEKRKVGGSTPPLTTHHHQRIYACGLRKRRCPDCLTAVPWRPFQTSDARCGPVLGARRVHGGIWMQTNGALLLVVKLCSLACGRLTAQDGRSAPALLYSTAVQPSANCCADLSLTRGFRRSMPET
jgi:anti-sigma B factor antagonist